MIKRLLQVVNRLDVRQDFLSNLQQVCKQIATSMIDAVSCTGNPTSSFANFKALAVDPSQPMNGIKEFGFRLRSSDCNLLASVYVPGKNCTLVYFSKVNVINPTSVARSEIFSQFMTSDIKSGTF